MTHRTAFHSIDVFAPCDRIWSLCVDVSQWPRFMPAVRQASTLAQSEAGDVIELVAEYGNALLRWQSKRLFDKQDRTISFERLAPQPPVSEMRGEWRVVTIPGGGRLELRHSYVLTDDNFAIDIANAIRSNATRDLAGIKKAAEHE